MTKDALEELVEAHQAELFHHLRFIGTDYPIAENLHQETFLRAFKSAAPPAHQQCTRKPSDNPRDLIEAFHASLRRIRQILNGCIQYKFSRA